ncbi:hypothetical protein PROFUN_06795 [Planoprotostelium fungivorum]|uniref:Uncharacterized protein n=1 Tax=Planoprotostelium fungivorum TaxID=1890364 RepID=A0A2P6NNN0_9EUKA|nr:hypothetical protein PROFUN_06795 [Planoprotostelium fungivorum]
MTSTDVRVKEAHQFITSVTGQNFAGGSLDELQESLKSGVILCKLVNTLKPGTIANVNTSNMAFKQMENVAAYIDATRKLGVHDKDTFVTVDLFEGKNMSQVVQNIVSLKRATGHGFDKQKDVASDNAKLNLLSPTASTNHDQTTDAKAGSQLNSSEEQKFGSKQDVKRTGEALVSGRQENKTAMTCGVCTKYITSGSVDALGRTWHPNCFTCKKCGVKLSTTKYYDHEKHPYCERCILIVKPHNIRGNVVDKGFSLAK